MLRLQAGACADCSVVCVAPADALRRVWDAMCEYSLAAAGGRSGACASTSQWEAGLRCLMSDEWGGYLGIGRLDHSSSRRSSHAPRPQVKPLVYGRGWPKPKRT
jgi:hypothetical protein